jgi:hypothetical protein
VTNDDGLTISRRKFFTGIFGVYALSNIFVDYLDITDEAFFKYCCELVLLICCAGLYIWWWRQYKRATEFYRCLTLLFCGMVFKVGFELYARWALISERVDYHNILMCEWWHMRGVPETIALIYMVSVILSRLTANGGHK